jgi:hypothetical protein
MIALQVDGDGTHNLDIVGRRFLGMWKCERCIGGKENVMGQIFDCEDVGIMNEYIGCKITRNLETNHH